MQDGRPGESWKNSNSCESWRNLSLRAAGHGSTKGGESWCQRRQIPGKRPGFAWQTRGNANWALPRGRGCPKPSALPWARGSSPAGAAPAQEGSTPGPSSRNSALLPRPPVMRRPFSDSAGQITPKVFFRPDVVPTFPASSLVPFGPH